MLTIVLISCPLLYNSYFWWKTNEETARVGNIVSRPCPGSEVLLSQKWLNPKFHPLFSGQIDTTTFFKMAISHIRHTKNTLK
jgi:hypothetical protein